MDPKSEFFYRNLTSPQLRGILARMRVNGVMDVTLAEFIQNILKSRLGLRVNRTKDGWAGYDGTTRVTRFFFTEQAAQTALDLVDFREY